MSMDEQNKLRSSPVHSITKSFRPYYSPQELSHLIKLQSESRVATNASGGGSSGNTSGGSNPRKEMSEARVENYRQLACGFIERVGNRLGFPRRTIATAQTLYHRFHLFFPLRDFSYQDVAISALLVASKLEDTLKKLREIQIASAQILNLLEGGPGTSDGDVATQEAHRPQLIAIERLILETICFNFSLHRSPFAGTAEANNEMILDVLPTSLGVNGKDAFGWVIRLGRALSASKAYILLAHLLTIDIHRTLAPLSYPPHTIALACLFLTSFMIPGHSNSKELRRDSTKSTSVDEVKGMPEFTGNWAAAFESEEEDVEDIAHALLNLLIQLCPTTSSTFPSPSFSPATPSMSPSAPPSSSSSTIIPNNPLSAKDKHLLQSGIPHILSAATLLAPYDLLSSNQIVPLVKRVEDFTRIKILLRERTSRRITTFERQPHQQNGDVIMTGTQTSNEREKQKTSRWVGSKTGLGAIAIEIARREREETMKQVRMKERMERGNIEDGGREREKEKEREKEERGMAVRYRF